MGEKKRPAYVQYVLGGSSGMGATSIVQPFDLIKTRMQISGMDGQAKEFNNTFDAFAKIIKKEGFLGLYKGLSAALLRQATYTTGRLGVYTSLNAKYKQSTGKAPNLLVSMALGSTAGGVAAVIGNPSEIVLIRMTADGRLPMAERRNYRGVFNALYRITAEEGLITLWRGCLPTVGRAMVVNCAQLASYSQFKVFLLNTGSFHEGIWLHFVASMFSGLITTASSLPVDIAKTRIQNMKVKVGEIPQYKNTIDVIVKVARHEGIFALWKGFTPYYGKLGPHTVLCFVFMEQLSNLYNKHFMDGASTSSGL